MVEFIVEFVVDFIFEGIIMVAGEKKAPMFLRVIGALFLIFVYAFFVGALFFMAIEFKSWLLFICAIVVAIIVLGAGWKKCKEYADSKHDKTLD